MFGPFELEGPALVVPARLAARLAGAFGVERFRVEVRGRDDELDALLWAWREMVRREQQRALAAIDPGSECGTENVERSELGASSSMMTSRDVARLADCSTRAVTKAALAGRLEGEQLGARWLFSPAAVDGWIEGRVA